MCLISFPLSPPLPISCCWHGPYFLSFPSLLLTVTNECLQSHSVILARQPSQYSTQAHAAGAESEVNKSNSLYSHLQRSLARHTNHITFISNFGSLHYDDAVHQATHCLLIAHTLHCRSLEAGVGESCARFGGSRTAVVC